MTNKLSIVALGISIISLVFISLFLIISNEIVMYNYDTINSNANISNINTARPFDSVNGLRIEQNELKDKLAQCRLPDDEIDTNRTGVYAVGSTTITILPMDRDAEDVERTFYHGLGHYIWYEKLKDFERNEYELIFNMTDEYVSDYAETRVIEDYAETYMEYRLGNDIPDDRNLFFKLTIHS